ncbi:MAG: hypothetical protein GWM92_05860, partial [Gemmatimonadetes bacterium]|nr:hypothetical protein [Gemmatimonadota bacterium]NIR78120.1 hypothetical protein [Gemmatimonadota bacterium]NIT86687.1 hypothetical protein [Gemmatimonadota bacterium]NIU30540.1 hypothetical protein [Gemmatimonadota bacterium]NIU35379.1 hypothetical protein [Gemmatimonadota bacterium]
MWWKILLGLVLLVAAGATVALRAGARRMGAWIDREVEAMIEALPPPATAPVSLDRFHGLPAPVRRYLATVGVEGRPPVDFARLRHGGSFSPDGGGRWMPSRGEEYFTRRPPAFLWAASIRAAPGLSVLARDTYAGGSGNMLVTLAGLVPIQDVRGPELDAASLLRWLSELPVLPSALLPDEHLSWEAVDDSSARARVRHGGIEVSGVYSFGDDGLPTGFSARRYRTEGDRQVEREWEGWYRDYREVEGLLVPG